MSVSLVIVSHSAQLAAGVVELARQMTQGKVALAAAGGGPDDILGTSADKILEAIEQVESADGVLLLLDLGSAILSAEMALELRDPANTFPIALSYAPLVEGCMAAAIEASLGHSLAQVKQAAEQTASAQQLKLLKPLSSLEDDDSEIGSSANIQPVKSEGERLEVRLTLGNPAGLHARPASLFVQMAADFQSDIQLYVEGKNRRANASSIMEVLGLAARQGEHIIVNAQGSDAQAALDALSALVQANFHETPDQTSQSEGQKSTQEAPIPPQQANKELTAPQSSHDPWHGITTSPGVALGPAFLYKSSTITLTAVKREMIDASLLPSEQEQVYLAIRTTAQELRKLAKEVRQNIGQDEGGIFEAQALMLQDPTLHARIDKLLTEQHLSGISALAEAGEQQAQLLAQLDNTLLAARAADVRDAVGRALRHLVQYPQSGPQNAESSVRPPGSLQPQRVYPTNPKMSSGFALGLEADQPQSLESLNQPIILLANDLTPSDTAQLIPELVLGICTIQGGPTAHAAIIARALGIPAISGLHSAILQIVHTGDELGLDAEHGLLYLKPGQEIQDQLGQRITSQQNLRAKQQQSALKVQGPLLVQGRHIHLLANSSTAAEAASAREWGAEGIGLLRTEFLFGGSTTLPDEDEQRQKYLQVFRAFIGENKTAGKPIVVRTLDAGADKPFPALEKAIGLQKEPNPALGLRGIRIHLAHEELLETQLSALLRAAGDAEIELHIMFPMITTIEELHQARAIFYRTYKKLQQQQVKLPDHVPVGIMIEVPAAALMAPELAKEADFFSIGANDLLQYTLACDRINTAVSYLYDPLQPAVLRSIHQIALAARQAGKPVAVCGEIASDVRLAPILVGMGIDELSMTPTALSAIREVLSQNSTSRLEDLVHRVLQASTVAEVSHACDEFFARQHF